MQPLGACTKVSASATRIEWVNRPYRTQIPPARLHDRWHVEIDLTSAGPPLRAAAMLLAADGLHHTRGWADQPAETVTYRVGFTVLSPDLTDDVQMVVNTGIQVTATSRSLAAHPRESVQLLVGVGDTLQTGAVIDLLLVRDLGWTAQVALLVATDTVRDRTRWHVRPALAVGAPYDFLMTGRRSGHGPAPRRTAPENDDGGA